MFIVVKNITGYLPVHLIQVFQLNRLLLMNYLDFAILFPTLSLDSLSRIPVLWPTTTVGYPPNFVDNHGIGHIRRDSFSHAHVFYPHWFRVLTMPICASGVKTAVVSLVSERLLSSGRFFLLATAKTKIIPKGKVSKWRMLPGEGIAKDGGLMVAYRFECCRQKVSRMSNSCVDSIVIAIVGFWAPQWFVYAAEIKCGFPGHQQSVAETNFVDVVNGRILAPMHLCCYLLELDNESGVKASQAVPP